MSNLDETLTALRQNAYSASGRRTTIGRVDIQLFSNYAVVKTDKVEKAITLMDLKAILDDQLNESSNLISTAMPPNCFIMAKSATHMELNCYFPEVIRDVKYINYAISSRTPEIYKIPFPNVILYISLNKDGENWHVNKLRYFCTSKKVTQLPSDKIISNRNPREGIFVMPFTNFYDDGRMCYGQNTMTSRFPEKNLRGVEWFYQVIFEGSFNEDLGVKGLVERHSGLTWLKKLSTLSSFPYELMDANASIPYVD